MKEEIKNETVGSAVSDDLTAKLRGAEVMELPDQLAIDAENARREAEYDKLILRMDAENARHEAECRKIIQLLYKENARLRAENEELEKHL